MSILKKYFPMLRMNDVCRKCCGNSDKFLRLTSCPVCKKDVHRYRKLGLYDEVEQFDYLRETWLKCKNYNQTTTGLRNLDNLLTVLWGKPHDNHWRDYSKKKPSDATVVRILTSRQMKGWVDDDS